MPAIGNLVLADGQASPANHTFAPVNIDKDGVIWWADRSGGIPLGYPQVSAFIRQPVGGNGGTRTYRETLKVKLPVLEVTSPSTGSGIQPAPTLSYECAGTVELILPERSLLQNRKDLRAYIRNLLADAMVTAMVENLEAPY